MCKFSTPWLEFSYTKRQNTKASSTPTLNDDIRDNLCGLWAPCVDTSCHFPHHLRHRDTQIVG